MGEIRCGVPHSVGLMWENETVRRGCNPSPDLAATPTLRIGALALNDASSTSVYLYYDTYGLLVYVGITSRGTKRNAEHNSDKEWWSHVARQDVEHYASRSEALRRERHLIRTHQPPFNTQHNPEHAVMRAAYVGARSFDTATETLKEHVDRLPEKRVDLEIYHRRGSPHLTLRTPIAQARVVAALHIPDEPVRVYGFGQPSKLNRIEVVGPFALMVLNKMRDAWRLKHAYMVVRYHAGWDKVVIKVVHVVADRESEVRLHGT